MEPLFILQWDNGAAYRPLADHDQALVPGSLMEPTIFATQYLQAWWQTSPNIINDVGSAVPVEMGDPAVYTSVFYLQPWQPGWVNEFPQPSERDSTLVQQIAQIQQALMGAP